MRPSLPPLAFACLAPALLAQSPADPSMDAQGRAPSCVEPGVSPALREELRASLSSTPHDLFIRDLRQPIPEASVLILEKLSPKELKLRAFEEFKVLMIRGLVEFLGRYSGTSLSDTRTLASNPPASSPSTVMVPLGPSLDF